jgi:probable HAF family extracellular repeat protein
MKRISILLLIFLFCFVVAPLSVAAQQNTPALTHYNVFDLGTLGGTYSLAGGVNNSGLIEGEATTTDGYNHAVLWRNEKIKDLGTLGGPNSDAGWRPSETGDIAGGSETGAVDPYAEDYCSYGDNLICVPFFWQHKTKKMTQLPLLGGNNGWAGGVNDFDVIVGNSETTAVDPTCAGTTEVFQFEPVIWTNGRIKQLPNFPGDPDGAAFSINFWGQVAGYSGNCTTGFHALRWENGKAINLGNLGGTQAEGIDINNFGQVAGLATLSGDVYYHAFLWTWGSPLDLGALPGDVSSSGDGLNDWGQVVGGSYDADGNSRAFIWQNGVMTDLNTLIPATSPLYLLEATGTINDSGEIAGIGLQISTGDTHAFLLTPVYGPGVEATNAPRPRVVLPENVRRALQQRRPFSNFKGGPIRPR